MRTSFYNAATDGVALRFVDEGEEAMFDQVLNNAEFVFNAQITRQRIRRKRVGLAYIANHRFGFTGKA